MELGAFSVSLAVKSLAASRVFYETLGFEVFGGVAEQNWLILRNGSATIGLFEGMFEKNILTFNPGWTSAGETLDRFHRCPRDSAPIQGAGARAADRGRRVRQRPGQLRGR